MHLKTDDPSTDNGQATHTGKMEHSINGFLNAKTELLQLLVIIDFSYGKLVKTT